MELGVKEAKRKRSGLLIFFVDPSNAYAKQLEIRVFRDPEMARFVNRNFIPVKINLDQYPEWRQIILPFQRLRRYFEPGAELVVTRQDGTLVNQYVIDSPFQYIGSQAILPFLILSKGLLRQEPSSRDLDPKLPAQQSTDIQLLAANTVDPIPAYSEFSQALQKSISPDETGQFRYGSTRISPMSWRVLAKLGQTKLAANAVQSATLTPLYDALDGGYFREARATNSSLLIDTGKSSLQNALCAEVVAQLACTTHRSDLKTLALDIGNDVISDFLDGDGLSTSRLNDQGVDNRSKRSSLTNGRLGSILSSIDSSQLLKFASKSQSPDQDLFALTSLSALSNPDFLRIRQTIHEKLPYAPGLSEPDHIAIDGYLAARLFGLYRYTNDQRFLSKAQQISQLVYSSVNGTSIGKIYGNRQLGPGWLGSYLAVADCGLAEYAATGNIYPLRTGEIALQQAIFKFRDNQTGLLDNVPASALNGFSLTPATPNLVDAERESSNAQAIRLAYHYSVSAESPISRGEFKNFAQGMLAKLNSVMSKSSLLAAGYFDAAFDVTQNSAVMVVGPNRVEICLKLAKILPLSVIYPMSVANSLNEDHLYIRRGEVLEGPFNEAEIQKKMIAASRSYPE